MSNYDRPGPLDGVIDEAVRDMMQVDPRPGLRLRVAGSIGSRPPSRVRLQAGLAWAAALALVVLASVLLLRSPEPVQPAATRQVVAAPPAVPAVVPPAGPQAGESPRAATVRTPARRGPTSESIFGARTTRVAAASLPLADLPVTSSSSLEDVPMEPAPGSVAWIAPITVTPIHVAPLAIAPLTVSALSNQR